MANKKRYEGEKFNALHMCGSGGLAVRGETLEGIRQEIDDANERAMSRGYKEEQFIITHMEWYKYYDDEGIFLKEETIEQRIEIYPKVLKILGEA